MKNLKHGIFNLKLTLDSLLVEACDSADVKYPSNSSFASPPNRLITLNSFYLHSKRGNFA